MSNASLIPVPKPDHVPAELVRDFDIFDVPGSQTDIQLALRAVQQSCPDIFWTPRNGGHWVATRAKDIEVMQRDHGRFSNNRYLVPKKPPGVQRELPLETDPPRHTALRRPLTLAFTPRVVSENEPRIRALAIELIEGFLERRSCEFVAEFAQVFPIGIFLDFMQLPREDRHSLLPIVKKVVGGRTPAIRLEGQHELLGYIGPIVRRRRTHPGDDILSRLVNVEDGAERISEDDAISYATLVLFGGLDTVAAMLSLVARFLALSHSHLQDIVTHIEDDAFLQSAVEELIRRHGLATTAREIVADLEYGGVTFKQGEMILLIHMLAGLDERKIADPLSVDFRRPRINTHAAFGSGAHSCPGAGLARREMKVFLQEWLRRIPTYRIAEGSTPASVTGFVSGLTELQLSW
jgi:cytochrome P450